MATRRSMLIGLGSLLAAPAVVKADSLMKIAVLRDTVIMAFDPGPVDATVIVFKRGYWFVEKGAGMLWREVTFHDEKKDA